MSESIPQNHPLRALFQAALDKAFTEFADCYSPGVAEHLGDDVLCDFIHNDRIYRLRGAQGGTLEDLPRMLEVAATREGPERRLEVDSYIGDFTLFMGGFFPASISQNRWSNPLPMVSRVGQIFVRFEHPFEYYAAEGRNAYGRAAATARLFAPDVHDTFSLLAERFETYVELLRRVKTLIAEDPDFQQVQKLHD